MAFLLYKWFGWIWMVAFYTAHPIYVSVTEIEHNAKEKTLEISCRIFTDDFENTLRKQTGAKVDLLHPANPQAMDLLVNNYISDRFKIWVDGKPVTMKFIGYEPDEEAIRCYFSVDSLPVVHKLKVQQSVLYDFKPTQSSFFHLTVNGIRKSKKLVNPESVVEMEW